MKRTILFFLLLWVATNCFAQSESEPNNTFATASFFAPYDVYTASVGDGDAIDYWKVNTPYNKSFYLLVEATNISGNDAWLKLEMYDGRQGTGLIHTRNISNNLNIPDGETVYDTIFLCAQAADDYFLAFTTNESFDYSLQWYPVYAYNNDEPNNNSAQAVPFGLHTVKEGAIRYNFRGGINDTEDWYQSGVLPAGDYGNIQLYLTGLNNSCSGGTKWIYYQVFKSPDMVNPFAQGYIGNTLVAPQYVPVVSVIPLDNMTEGDIFKVRLTSNAPFGYSLRYSDMPPFIDDEDNCCYFNAIPLAENFVAGGNVGWFDEVNYEFLDEFDTYQIVLPHDGAINLFAVGELAGSGPEDISLQYDLLDKYGNELLTYQDLVTWTGYPNFGDVKRDTVKIRGLVGDTFYLRLHTYNDWSAFPIINYNIKYQFLDSTGGDIEPNNDTASAILLVPGEVKKGHVKFLKDAYEEDYSDHYKAQLPKDGQLKVYIKARYRGQYVGGDIIWGRGEHGRTESIYASDALSVTYINNNQRYFVPALEAGEILSDSLYTDTLSFCPSASGMAYFEISSDRAYEYEISYELTDTISWVNDIEPNNSFAQAQVFNVNEQKSGRLRYVQDKQGASQDTYDYYRPTNFNGGKLKIYVEATNATCNATSWIKLEGFNSNTENSWIFDRDIGGTTMIPPGATVYDTISPCFYTDATLYLRLSAIQNFRYKIRYEIEQIDTTEREPDNTTAQATRIGTGQNRGGFLGLKYGGISDVNDYYKLVIAASDTFRLHWQATNLSCTDNRLLRIWGYNRLMQQVFLKGYVLNAVGTIDAGVMVADSLKRFFTGPDTLYIRFEGNGLFKYDFQSELLSPSNWFKITGDTTACEGGEYIYRVANLVDSNLTFHWSLPNGGGTINYTDSIATVVWNQNGNRNVRLHVSNAVGSSPPVTLNVIVNGEFPTQTPVAYNFARTLSTNSLPPGSTCQWYRNDTLIAGATDSSYYAADAGAFTVKFVNDCGPGPASNAIIFDDPAQPQIITFPHVATVTMSPTAKATLEASSSSSLPVFYQRISGPGTLLNDTLFVTGAGTIVIKATQPGNDVYSAAAPVNDTITVIKGNQFITFDSIPDQILNATSFVLPGSSSSGLTLFYSIITGNNLGTLTDHGGSSAWSFNKKGAGIVTVRAAQTGNNDYNAAAPVERTFCIGLRTLTPIIGDAEPCMATYQYRTQKIPGAIYIWTLSGGGTLTTHNDTAWVQWQTPGSYTLKVKATSPCDPVFTNEQVLDIATSNNIPGVVSGMLPLNGAIDQQLPLTLSWIPGTNTVNYDLYIWDSTATEPVTPYISDINSVNYIIPKNAPFPYYKTYKWKIVAKNPCAQTVGPIQTFRLIPLPDLVVSDVQAPPTATSGQTITVSWKVTNAGPGRTLPNTTWYDGVYFALDTVPNVSFAGSPNWSPSSWSSLTANGRPLLLGKKIRPSSLDSGQFYTNSLDFTLPLQYSFPVYIYVITDNEHPNWKVLQVSVANDTARMQDPMMITLAPTPDLRVDSVFTPSSTFSGSTINVTYKVKNYGVVTPAGSSWVDSVFISQNPLFDRSSAIPVNAPKLDGSYYPNAARATGSHATQLLPDSTVTKSIPVVIPNYIFGTWFVYVKTNARTTDPFVYEGALANNNLGQAQLQVYLTPTPKLTISSLTLPVTNASTTQQIGASWNIKNEGFKDNIEKDRGHYITMGSCPVSCSSPCAGCVCYAAAVVKDSVAFGSSYWLDRVYLSTDSTGLNLSNAVLVNEVKQGILNSGLYPDPKPPHTNFVSCPAAVYGNVNVHNIINPGADFPRDTSFRIPADLQPGSYYVYVYTNPTKTVWEYPGTPQIKRSALPVTIQRPDATIPSISAPSASAGGQQITINYSVVNNGPGAVFNHQRSDRLYISNFSNFDGSAQLVGTQTYMEDLPVGALVPHAFAYAIPPATTGNKYFYVITNYDSLFRETNSTNNTSAAAATNVSAALPADLVVSSVQPLDSVFTLFPTTFKYTVANNGTGTTLGTWTDSLFISCNSTFNAATAKFVTKRVQTRSVVPGGNYTDSFSHTMTKMSYEINSCFPEQMYAPGYFFVKANADTGTYEGTNLNNNITRSNSRVIVNPLVDHIVSSVSSGLDTVVVGIPFTASWKVKNVGYKPVPAVVYYYSYYDGIYFSFDSLVNSNDVIANGFLTYGLINRNDSLTSTRSIMTPNIASGDYYMIAKTNYSDHLKGEKILSNNHNFLRNASGAAQKVHVIRPLQPDLVDSIVAAPSSIAAGQPMTVVYRITNNGVGITYPGPWQNELRLSEDFLANPNDGDRLLATRTRQAALAPGESYLDTVTVTIPSWTPAGNYVLIGRTNSNAGITEFSTGNNLGFHLLEVYRPDSTDLIVNEITAADTVYLGYELTPLKWKISNASGTDAIGYMTDGVYLSADNLFDSTAVLMGTRYRHINLSPLEIDSASISPIVKDVVEGNYNVFARTDLLSNIIESDKNNNIGMSANQVYVKVKELVIDIPENSTLQTVNRYYKLKIPDSLIGSTILVTLKSPDSLTMKNELFIGGGFVPTAAHYDYRFEIPNYGNQQIVMTSVTEPVYYIMYRCVSPNPVIQNITLKAVKLPFAILNVHTNSGGNIGNVTVRISGSLFRDSMVARLSNGPTTIYSSAVYFTNSTQVFATFNLQGRPLGIYDLILIKPDSSTAVLPNGFSIVPANNGGLITGGGVNTGSGNGNDPGCDPGAASGLNSQLVVQLVIPSRVLIKRPVVILVNYSNPTNFDIPAQSRILFSEAGIKMAFTREGIPTGTTSLYLELTEPGGPPGIIRAGGSGTIIVHCNAPDHVPQPDNKVLFKLQ